MRTEDVCLFNDIEWLITNNNPFVFYSRRLPLLDVVVETTARSGEYDVAAEVLLADSSLETPTVFLCELRISDTSYRNTKTITYYPGTYIKYTDVHFYIVIIQKQVKVNARNLFLHIQSEEYFKPYLIFKKTEQILVY